MQVEKFKEIILEQDFDDILTNILLSDEAKHCNEKDRDFIKKTISSKFKLESDDTRLIVVGSAKLGFSITEKIDKSGNTLKRYRPFRADSDIDIAVVSPKLYDIIWNELSSYSYNQPYSPWNSGKLGDYMVGGWLRPDFFPARANLRKCDDWWNIFRFLSTQNRLGRRKVRGGIYYNFEHLKYYQSKGLRDCIEFEKLAE